MSDIFLKIIFMGVPFLMAITVHEVGHALVSDRLGDPTPRSTGRITLNPVAHLDPIGTLMFILTAWFSNFIFGWAKPVQVDPRYYKNPRTGLVAVSAAGAAANFLLAGIFLIIFKFLYTPESGLFVELCRYVVIINIYLGFFNLLPIPPLDGSKILAGLLPAHLARRYAMMEQYQIIFIVVLFATGILKYLFIPVNILLYYLLQPW